MSETSSPVLVANDRAAISPLPYAIAEALVYADVFDYPLTIEQIQRYLVRVTTSAEEVERALEQDLWLKGLVQHQGDLVCLAGRAQIFAVRRQREQYARVLSRAAERLAWLAARLAFVRMVAVIGSLTMDNVRSPKDDIDLFIIAAPGRVWLARAMVIGLVRLAALVGLDLCPNYILSSRRLLMPPDDLFTAHELAQMVPLSGSRSFAELLAANTWLATYMPNATPHTGRLRDVGAVGLALQRLAECFLGGRLGDRLERSLQQRKLGHLRRQALGRRSPDVFLDAEVCKGHTEGHGSQIRGEFARRWNAFLAAHAPWDREVAA